jgi:hypothetical protein
MKFQSPLVGFNNNVRHKGRVFHIQTEDSGVKHPHIITHLFADGGRILQSTKTSYAEFVGEEDLSRKVRSLMQEQHKAMFIALRAGKFDHLVETVPAEAKPSSPGTARQPLESTLAIDVDGEQVSAPRRAPTEPGLASVPPPPPSSQNAVSSGTLGRAPTQPALRLTPPTGLRAPEASPSTRTLTNPGLQAANPQAPLPSHAPASPLAREPTPQEQRKSTIPPAAPRISSPVPRPFRTTYSVKSDPRSETPIFEERVAAPTPPFGTMLRGRQENRKTPPTTTTKPDPRVPPPPPPPSSVDPHQPNPIRGRSVPPPRLPMSANIDLDLDTLERAAEQGNSPVYQQVRDMPPPPAAVLRPQRPSTSNRSFTPEPAQPNSNSGGRYAPSRPASIFGSAKPHEGASIFGEDLISEKSLDEVILSYLAEDLADPKK